MSYTLFNSATAATDLIAQPGRAVNTFPSGLVRVDQVYLGLTANAATHRAILAVGNDMPDGDTSPCLDGLKIFPDIQERRREDGWTEYLVSAYGRANSTGKISKSMIISTVQIPAFINITNLPPGSTNSTKPIAMPVVVATTAVTRSAVVPASALNSEIPLPQEDTSFQIISDDAILTNLKYLWPTGRFIIGDLTGKILVLSTISQINRSGFGTFDETTATLSGTPKVIGSAMITRVV